jgi:predicted cupin superfamily sugar epimerase
MRTVGVVLVQCTVALGFNFEPFNCRLNSEDEFYNAKYVRHSRNAQIHNSDALSFLNYGISERAR